MKYKLVALDIDGTTLNSRHEISAETEKWINTALKEGVHVCFSTGRSIRSVYPYLLQLGLKTPVVTVNGSEVWSEPDQLKIRHLMDVDIVKQMHKIAVELDVWYWAYTVEGLFNNEKWAENADALHWMKFGFQTEDEQKLQHIRHILQSWGTLEITNSSPINLELNPKGISKASGLQEVCRLLNINMSQVVAMGDSLNDIAMIQAVGLGVAMGNAQEEVKRVADFTTATNDEDGVAQVIREHVLNR